MRHLAKVLPVHRGLIAVSVTAAIAVTASRAQSQTRRVQVAYVIPSGQSARPQAAQAIGAIMTTLQRHYLQQLGTTFELADPLITNLNPSADVATSVDWGTNLALIKNRLSDGYINNQNIVYSILEGTTGAGGGSYGIVKMTGGFWDQAYQTYVNEPYNLHTVLHGWSHELGHAFGLGHTADFTKGCLAGHQVDMGTLPSLIMQKTDELGSAYNYTFHAQEKKLLSDSTYYPDCLSLRSEKGQPVRPFATAYLRRNAVQPTLAHGRNAVRVDYASADGATSGRFVEIAPRRWAEQDMRGTSRYTFDEQQRDDWSVLLVDASRGVNMQLDLFAKKVMYRDRTSPQSRVLYNITGAVGDPNGRTATQVAFGDATNATKGLYVHTGNGTWEERSLPGKQTSYRFQETGRDDWSVYLRDATRGVSIQLDLFTRRVMYSDRAAPTPRPFYTILWAD